MNLLVLAIFEAFKVASVMQVKRNAKTQLYIIAKKILKLKEKI